MTPRPSFKGPRLRNAVLLQALLILGLLSTPVAADGSAGREGRGASKDRGGEALEAAVKGRVFGETKPVSSASVFAYDVVNRVIQRVLTDRQGHFLFSALPKGMYQLVAFKRGFAPGVESLLRRRDDLHQFVEIKLKEVTRGDVREAEDYWAVRSRIPTDIFREIQALELAEHGEIASSSLLNGAFAAEMLAHGGVEQLGGDLGDAQLTTAELDVQGAIGDLRVGVQGAYQQLVQTGETQIPDGQTRALSVEIQGGQKDSTLRLTTAAGQSTNLHGSEIQPVDLEHHQLDWSAKTGEHGRSRVRAQYTQELGYNQPGWMRMADIPEASRLLNIEGVFAGKLSERTTLEAGVSYRQLDGQVTSLSDFAQMGGMGAGADPSKGLSVTDGEILGYGGTLSEEAIGLFGRAGSQIRPRVLVEFGLFSSVRDGSLSLMPQGGMVVQLGESDWKARASMAQRVEDEREGDEFAGFRSAFYKDRTSCQQAGEACYEVTFTRGANPDDEISLGAVHREFAETLRIYFSPDFFDRLESVFVVDGDTVPELQFRMVRRFSPRVLAKLESNFAAGGGGIFYATNDALSYENEVRYLVTSLDTQFQQTSTGVFVAFHHLEQALNPVDTAAARNGIPEIEVQRLQLMLTQDLNILANMASSNWAVRFNVELSRGATPYTLTNDDEISKKLSGGLSVSF